MCLDTNRATQTPMENGGRSKSNCARREGCRRSPFMPDMDILRRAAEKNRVSFRKSSLALIAILAMSFCGTLAFAQNPPQNPPIKVQQIPPPPDAVQKKGNAYT